MWRIRYSNAPHLLELLIMNVFHNHTSSIDEAAQAIAISVVALANNPENIEQLARLTEALHSYARSTDAYATMETSLYSLDEYVSLKLMQLRGDEVNADYIAQLHDELINNH